MHQVINLTAGLTIAAGTQAYGSVSSVTRDAVELAALTVPAAFEFPAGEPATTEGGKAAKQYYGGYGSFGGGYYGGGSYGGGYYGGGYYGGGFFGGGGYFSSYGTGPIYGGGVVSPYFPIGPVVVNCRPGVYPVAALAGLALGATAFRRRRALHA